MCGIVGYIGRKRAAPILLEGLKKLEYRGYDSAGIALLRNGRFFVMKKKGRVKELEEAENAAGNVGIGHTRWATHGAPTEGNAHPHLYGKFAIVHNGIIENYLRLKEELLGRGECFSSETDSEVIVHFLEREYSGDFLQAMRRVSRRLEGAYAIAALCVLENKIVVARNKSPIVLGRGADGCFCASDLTAIAAENRSFYSLSEGEFAELTEDGIRFYDSELNEIKKEPLAYNCAEEISDKKGYRHYMRKEIDEIPQAVENTILNFTNKTRFLKLYEVLCHAEYIHIVACGTAYHSGIAAKYAIERLARIPAEAFIASEYRYCDPVMRENTVVVAVSQSGETADTIAAARKAKECGGTLIALTNVAYSSITADADIVLYTRAGREIAVAATKSYNAQLSALYAFAIILARAKGKGFPEGTPPLRLFPRLCEQTLAAAETVRAWTPYFSGAESVYFLGRGADYCTALEGSLKLKEISYLPGEGYPAGELKHGTLALVGEGTPVVAILTQKNLAEKTMNAVHEAYARGGRIFLVSSFPEYCCRIEITGSIIIPDGGLFSPVLSVIPLQTLAYYVSLARGNDPDKPRNLAKSVTVE